MIQISGSWDAILLMFDDGKADFWMEVAQGGMKTSEIYCWDISIVQ